MRTLFGPVINALRVYWPAFLGIQACAACLVIAYYSFPAVREACAVAAAWKEHGGLLFAAFASVVSGGVIPELIKAGIRPRGIPRPSAIELVHQFGMFAILGIAVERFYTLQALLFGQGTGWSTVIPKILLDQFGYTTFVALPFIVIWYLLRENAYGIAATWRACRLSLVASRVLPILAGNCFFWIPSMCCVYRMPLPLQFLLFLALNGAWCLLLIFMARRQIAP